MIDYKQGAGQKRRLTLDYDATREAVAQAGGVRVGRLERTASRVASLRSRRCWPGRCGMSKRSEQSMAVVTFAAKGAGTTVVGNAESKSLGAFELHCSATSAAA